MTIVFIAPIRTRNDSGVVFLKGDVASIAAWAAPSPGRKPHRVDATKPADKVFVVSFIFIFGFVIFCGGIFDFSNRLTIKIDIPNNPESKGSRGCFSIGRLKTAIPNIPDNKKRTNAQNLDFESFAIKKIDAIIRIYGTRFFIRG